MFVPPLHTVSYLDNISTVIVPLSSIDEDYLSVNWRKNWEACQEMRG